MTWYLLFFAIAGAASGPVTSAFVPVSLRNSKYEHYPRGLFSNDSSDVVSLLDSDDPTAAVSTRQAKNTLIALLKFGEDENSPTLTPSLEVLKESYKQSGIDARTSENPSYNGDWQNVNTPDFPGRLGFSEQSLPLYTIGTLTFNLIPAAKHVVCAVERMVQHVHFVGQDGDNNDIQLPPEECIPKELQPTVYNNPSSLRTNKIDTVFTIPESNVKGILRMEGYTIPNATNKNRYDTWFLGGRCFARDGVDPDAWTKIFGSASLPSSTHLNGDDKLQYTLRMPMTAYQTVVYLDHDLRVSIGNRGSVMITGAEKQ